MTSQATQKQMYNCRNGIVENGKHFILNTNVNSYKIKYMEKPFYFLIYVSHRLRTARNINYILTTA